MDLIVATQVLTSYLFVLSQVTCWFIRAMGMNQSRVIVIHRLEIQIKAATVSYAHNAMQSG